MFVKLKPGLYLNPINVSAIEGASVNKDACNVIMITGHTYHFQLSAESIRTLLEGNVDALIDRNKPV